eukprot:525783-Amphidinium_carterae.1
MHAGCHPSLLATKQWLGRFTCTETLSCWANGWLLAGTVAGSGEETLDLSSSTVGGLSSRHCTSSGIMTIDLVSSEHGRGSGFIGMLNIAHSTVGANSRSTHCSCSNLCRLWDHRGCRCSSERAHDNGCTEHIHMRSPSGVH